MALVDADLAGAICVAPETLYYLCGYEGYSFYSPQALVVSASGSATMLIVRDTDVPLAAETSIATEVRSYHLGRDEPTLLIRDALAEMGLLRGPLGTEKQSYAMPMGYGECLRARFPPSVMLSDCSWLLNRLRVQKSPAELSYVRSAAEASRGGTAAAINGVRAGLTEMQLAAAIERGLRDAGSDYSAMPTMVASGPRTALTHAAPTTRPINDGEPVVMWYAGVSRRYHVTAYRTVHVGQPSRRFQELYGVAGRALKSLQANVRLGAPVAAAARAASRVLRSSDCESYHVARWGYGVGIAYPPVWLEAFDVIEESKDIFLPGTLMCLHVCFSVPNESMGFYLGGDYLLTEDGVEPLGDIDTSLVVV